jgi:outer membrane autotransporter protein
MVSKDRRAQNKQKENVTTVSDRRRATRSYVRARLLSGASSLTLAIASTIVALGVCIPGDAHAQTTTIHPVQGTTFILDSAQNPITFDSQTNITITGSSAAAVTGGAGTAWDVTNLGTLAGTSNGVFLSGAGSKFTNGGGGTISGGATDSVVELFAGGTVINQANGTISGGLNGITIIGGGDVTNAGNVTGTGSGVSINGGATVTNQLGGTIKGDVGILISAGAGDVTNAGMITGVTKGISFAGAGSSLVNSGTITQTDTSSSVSSAVFLANGGTVTNQAGANITAAINGIFAQDGGATPTTVDNFGTIKATDGLGTGVRGNVSSLTNHSGGKITSGGEGINLSTVGATITNEQGATITGGSGGLGVAGIVVNGSVINAGTISGVSESVRFIGSVTNTLTLQAGSVLNGNAVGSTGATNKLIVQGVGISNNNFVNFNTLDVGGIAQATGWTLNGNSVVGTTRILNSARLLVGDETHPGAVLIGNVTTAGGVLAGHGTVDGDVTGVVHPGFTTTASTTLTVTGNVTFGLNSVFRVNANRDGTADKLVVGKRAILAGPVDVVAIGTGFAPSTKYTILAAAGGVTGAFNSVTSRLAFLTPSLTYDANDVFLTLVCTGTSCSSGSTGGGGTGGSGTGGGSTGGGTTGGGATGGGAVIPGFGFATVAQTRNQRAVATSLDGGVVSNPLVIALLNQTIDGARRAFDALSGEVYGSLHNVQAEEAQFARSGMLGRMRQMSYAGVADELGVLGFGGPQMTYASGETYAADVPVKAPPREASHGLTFWAQGLGGWGHSDSDSNAASLTNRFGGFLSGADMYLGETWRAGLVAGYVRSDLNVGARSSSAGIDSVQFGGYAGGRLGAVNVRGGVSYSLDSIDTSRSIFFPGFSDQAKARFHGNVGQVFGEVGYGMAFGRMAVEPIAGLAYVHLHDNSFVESARVAALSGSAGSEDTGYSTLGVRVATAVPFADGTVLVPRGSLQWQHAFGDVTPSAAFAFQGTGTAFSIAGVPIARDTALVEGGFDWRFTPQMKLGAFYQGELAAHAQTHALKGTFTWDF